MELTLQEEKQRIKAYIAEKSTIPSVYTCWDVQGMKFGAHTVRGRKPHLLPPADIERMYYAGEYADSDMFILKAMDCFTYAPAECLMMLLRFWRRRDVRDASEKGRPVLAIPEAEYYGDVFDRLVQMTKNGLVCRYDFYPMSPKPGKEGKTESVYKASGHAVGFYKRKLLDGDMSYDPRDGYCNAEDAFAYCLGACAVSAFLGSPFLRNVEFKREYMIGNRRHKVRAQAYVNQEGPAGRGDDDTLLLFEGITYKTNENLVTLEARHGYNRGRLTELTEVVRDRLATYATFLVVCVEDSYGLARTVEILRDVAPDMTDRVLLTTGNVLYAAETVKDGSRVRRCFLSVGASGVTGATGYYFLSPPKESGNLSSLAPTDGKPL